MRIIAEETAALVIDFQERLVPAMYGANGLLYNTEILLKGLSTLEIPIIATQQYTKGIGMTVPSIAKLIGNEFSYYDKLSFSCVDDIAIDQRLTALGKKNIIVCGIEAHVCVLQTVIDLIQKDYQVILIENCISSRKENDCKIAVQRAIAEGAVIATYESILFELTRKAGTAVFKEISNLIK